MKISELISALQQRVDICGDAYVFRFVDDEDGVFYPVTDIEIHEVRTENPSDSIAFRVSDPRRERVDALVIVLD